MSRKKKEINSIRAERINAILKHEKITQRYLAEAINMTPQNLNRMLMLKNTVTDQTVDLICEKYPMYRKSWLKGDDDYMTERELTISILQKGSQEANQLNLAFSSFALLAGYRINTIPMNGSADKTLISLKEYCTIEKDGKKIALSPEQLIAFENELCDYVDFRLQHMMK